MDPTPAGDELTANVFAALDGKVYAVDGSGAPVLYHPLTPAPDSIVAAVGEAIRKCEWVPGADPNGRSVPLWLTLPVRLEGR